MEWSGDEEYVFSSSSSSDEKGAKAKPSQTKTGMQNFRYATVIPPYLSYIRACGLGIPTYKHTITLTCGTRGSLAVESLMSSMVILFDMYLHLTFQSHQWLEADRDEIDRSDTNYKWYTYTLKDGTIVKGKQGVTFAGFIPPPPRAPKETPATNPMRETPKPPDTKSPVLRLTSKTPLTMAPDRSALKTSKEDRAVQTAAYNEVKKRALNGPTDDTPTPKKRKWGRVETLNYSDSD
ncbi:hypothetical protein F5Y09DRAFT_300762 [Xylaria sp. FL1042]|nr:hypothetical protein F5Y09DRAFT_300762 [Xylaria sp. FL1042]